VAKEKNIMVVKDAKEKIAKDKKKEDAEVLMQ
jgi:hypothetical protein